MKKSKAVSIVAAMFFAIGFAFADNDIDLHVNGDFRGAAVGQPTAPGWTCVSGAGSTSIVQGRKPKDFCLLATAAAGQQQIVVSNIYPVMGPMLKLEVKVSGSGFGTVGIDVYDAAGQVVLSGTRRQSYQAQQMVAKVSQLFPIDPAAKFVRIVLIAEPGSAVTFGDVDAEFKLNQAFQAPVAPAPVAQPAPVASAPVAQPASVAAQPTAPAVMDYSVYRPLINDKYYFWRTLGADEKFQVSLPSGSDIDFELGEEPSTNSYWQVVSVNPSVCRVKIEHERDGFWPIELNHSEVELKALMRGSCDIVLSAGQKRVTIHFTSL